MGHSHAKNGSEKAAENAVSPDRLIGHGVKHYNSMYFVLTPR